MKLDMNMKLSDMIESKYMKQEDLNDEPQTFTIVGLKKENVAREDQDPKYKVVIKLKEFPRPFVANPTNLRRIAVALGSDDGDLWVDKQIVLFVDPDVEMGGKITGGIRVDTNATKQIARHRQPPSRGNHDERNPPPVDGDDNSVPF